ncbi:MAG: Do family serine endopeptidase [Gemmatimonadetes bacterium]|nr:Do family serine endopeptidase [Gemmatimonadota bacterium]
MTTRTRDWIKLSGLVALALVLALAFAAAVNLPRRSEAQQAIANLAPAKVLSTPAAKPAADLSEAFVAVAQAVRPAVVFIEAEQRTETSSPRLRQRLPPPFDQFFPDLDVPQQPRVRRGEGSGFIISSDGYILTNNHVVDEADKLKVKLIDKRQFTARLVGRDPDTDVAVIKIDATGLPSVPLGNSDETNIGEWVLAVGNPLGEEFAFTVTAGIVSAKGRRLADLANRLYSIGDFIQTDAAINPGNSGGPLVNLRGQVIGINSAIASPTGLYSGYGFAIPINLARTVSEQLMAHGKVTRAVLGISIRNADPDDAAYVGLDSIRGVVVLDFPRDDSPAKRAGLQAGDVIVALDGQPIAYDAQLQQIVGFKRPGEKVQVTIVRKGGERRTYAVTLAAREDTEQRVASNTSREPRRGSSSENKVGLTVEPLTEQVSRETRIGEEHRGLVVTSVDPDGPAAEKGIGPRVIITHVNGQRVRTMGEFEKAMEPVKKGDVVSLQIYLLDQSGQGRSTVIRLRAGG